MKMFVGWIKEGEEHKTAFENSSAILMGQVYLRGTWNVIRKIRLVRLIRKMIEEGIVVRGVKEIYEEGCKILSEMERREVKEDEEEYMFELYMMKVRGIEKKIKEDEVELLRRKLQEVTKRMEEEKKMADQEAEKKVAEEKRKREEAERRLEEVNKRMEEEKNRADEERRKREEAEGRTERMQKEMEEMKKKMSLPSPPPSDPRRVIPIASSVITSLDGTSVTFTPSNHGIKREGNTIIHHGSNSFLNCFIGGEMRSV